MTKGRDRAWDWAETVLLRHQDVLLSCEGPCREPQRVSELTIIYSVHFYKAQGINELHISRKPKDKHFVETVTKMVMSYMMYEDGFSNTLQVLDHGGSHQTLAMESLVCSALLDLQPSFIIFTDTVQTLSAFVHFTIWPLSKRIYPHTNRNTPHNTNFSRHMCAFLQH